MKDILRLNNLQARNSLSRREVKEKSAKIGKTLASIPEFGEAKAVLFYASFGNEVETYGLIGKALCSDKKVCVPVASFKEMTIKVSEISSLNELETKNNGLVEPKKVKEFPLKKIGLILVPGIAFDARGYRIGYGGGFYDRLLVKAERKTSTIGLCFEQNIVESIPSQSHDTSVDKIVTEKRVIDCRGN